MSVLIALNKFFRRTAAWCLLHPVFVLGGLLFFSLALKLLLHYLDPALGRDASLYCRLGQNWHDTGEFSHTWIPPLFPFTLMCGISIGLPVETAGLMLNITAGTLCVLVGYGIAQEITENKKIALLTAAFLAVHPGINALSIEIQRDISYLFWTGITIWSAIAGLKRKNVLFWCISGVCCTFAALTRFETFELLPVIACGLLVAAITRKLSWKRAVSSALCFYALLFLSFFIITKSMGTEKITDKYQRYFTGKMNNAKNYFASLLKQEKK